MEGEDVTVEKLTGEMTKGEIVRLVSIAAELGISKVKLTGGEPLIREDIIEIVKGIAEIPGLADLSMTTNGTMLAPLAEELRSSGLKRVNISLPTLNGEIYKNLTGGILENAIKGVKAAVKAELSPVKINMLVLRGVNDKSVQEMVDFARENQVILQLIELEPLNISEAYYFANHKGLDEYEVMLKQRAVKVEVRQHMQNRRVYHLPDVTVEVVHPIENTEFCMHCTRIRITSDGKLKPCLMTKNNYVDVLTPMRNGANDEELIELFKLANRKRQPYNREAE